MPLYSYINEDTGEVKEVFQGMNDEHSYSENGRKWKRIYTIPQARATSFSRIDPNSYSSFNNWIDNGKGGKVGDLWDASKELSEKREKEKGVDPLKQKALKEYSNIRGGKPHPSTLSHG